MRKSVSFLFFMVMVFNFYAQSSDWTLRAVRIQGISFGKQAYYPLYDIHHGERFSYEQHNESLDAITRVLKSEGYLSAQVHDYFKYYASAKALDVILTIDKGPLFSIAKAGVVIRLHEGLTQTQVDQLTQVLQHTFMDSLKGSQYTEEAMTQCMKNIELFLEQRGLCSAGVEMKESIVNNDPYVDLAFVVNVEKVRSFEFFGNHYFSTKELLALVTHFGKDAGMLPSEILAQELLSEYHKKGFWQAHISTTSEGQKEFFVIQEGLRARVKDIAIKGIEAYSQDWVKKRFFGALKTKYYDADKEKQALTSFMNWYQEQGFWDITLLHKKHTVLEDGSYALQLIFDEGKRYHLAGITIAAYPELLTHTFFKNIYKKKFFAPSLLAQQKTYLLHYFKKQGHMYAAAKYSLQKKEDGWLVVWHVDPGPKITFGKTLVTGYTRAPYKTLLHQVAYKEGDVWNKEKLQNTVSRLRSLDLFERVHMQPVHGSYGNDTRDVLITVQEDDPFEAKLRLGYQRVSKSFAFKKESSYRVGATCLWRNPLEKADALFFDCFFTRFDRFASGVYKVPLFLNSPWLATVKGYAKKYIQPVTAGSKKSLYETDQNGFSLGISSHEEHVDLGCTAGFEWAKTKNVSTDLAAAMRFEADLVDKRIPYFVLQPTLYVDFLNDKLNPTQGMFASLSCKVMVPFEASSYVIKFLAEEALFIPVGPLTFAARVRFGHIFRKAFTAIMPPERFYLGGGSSLRAYQTDRCPPLGSFVDEQGLMQWVAQGGKSMFNINLELRIPIHSRSLSAVVFQDFGALEEDIHTLMTPQKPLAATGLGVRYATPLGPLRFDIGWKWHKFIPQESSYAWFLTFGHTF